MVAQEQGPLAVFRNGRRLIENIDDGEAVLHVDRHKKTRHDREMKGHMAFVAGTKIRDGVFRPLVRFGQEHPVAIFLIDVLPERFQESVSLRKIFAIGSFALIKVGHRIQAQAVHSHPEPEIDRVEERLVNLRVIEVQVRLVRVKAMPVVGFCHRVQ